MKMVKRDTEFNLGQNIVDKFTKLSKINFSIEYFTAHFSQFSSAIDRICLLGDRLGITINSKHFKDFLKIKLT